MRYLGTFVFFFLVSSVLSELSPTQFLEDTIIAINDYHTPLVKESNAVQQSPVYVTTPLGTIQGIQENGYRVFKGVRYAQSTAGNNRWAPPVPVTSWNGIYDATEFSAACPQNKDNSTTTTPFLDVPVSEDCLFLNIWAPKKEDITTPVPVMVWFHGGAFVAGWGGDGLFWGDFIVNSTSNTIIVTTNYRLGILGFFATPDLGGNYGFLDQQETLRWVKANIGAFGGDPNQVTIFGQSAGGMSCSLHLISPSSFGLFQKVIVESNPTGVNYRTPAQAYPYSEKLSSILGCNSTDLTCLRSKSMEEMLATQKRGYMIYFPIETIEFLPFAPIIDGTIIVSQPMDLYRAGQINNPYVNAVIMGNVRNETRAFLPNVSLDTFFYRKVVELIFAENTTAVLDQYPASLGSNYNQFTILTTDWLFTCATRFASIAISNSGIPTYLYEFTHSPVDDPINNHRPACQGAVCHSAEIPFVFHSDAFAGNGYFTTDESTLSWQTLTYWQNFAHGLTGTNTYSNVPWERFNQTVQYNLVFDIPVSSDLGYHVTNCDFWDSLGYYN